jgi:hypothetical protein
MVALLSFMTSFALVIFGLVAVLVTLRGQGAKIVRALAGEMPTAEIVPFPPRPRSAVRVTSPPYRALPEWRAAA